MISVPWGSADAPWGKAKERAVPPKDGAGNTLVVGSSCRDSLGKAIYHFPLHEVACWGDRHAEERTLDRKDSGGNMVACHHPVQPSSGWGMVGILHEVNNHEGSS